MVIILEDKIPEAKIQAIMNVLDARHLRPHLSVGDERTIIGVLGDTSQVDIFSLEALEGVERVVRITDPYKLASKTFHPEPDVFDLGKGVLIGGGHFVNMAGPCAIESYEQLDSTAEAVSRAGAKVLRGGAYKPRTSPYSFQGEGVLGLKWMREVADRYDMLVVSEVMSEVDIEGMMPYVDIFQIGTRNAQNFRLLKAVGQTNKAVLLKRGMAMTIDEWLSSAEYVLSEGNDRVILCERGIRTFERAYRATLDIAAVPVVRAKTHLPIIIDPSHAAGEEKYVPALALAATAVAADGLIIEVHPDPPSAVSDAAQQLTFDQYEDLMKKVHALEDVVGLEDNSNPANWL